MEYSPFALPTSTLLANTYRIDSLIGQGGFGLTYGGEDVKLSRPVAIKEFFPSGCGREGLNLRAAGGWQISDIEKGRTRFLYEGRALARFRHEGIVQIFSGFEANDTAYLVMEWLRGRTLSQVIEDKGGPLSVSGATKILLKVADALTHVHEAGLLHRDIKPDNILCCNDGRVLLLDFGLATDFNRGEGKSTRQLQTTVSAGTPGYAPLEQYSQRATLTPATDVYALSATLYFLLTGEEPLPATDRVLGTVMAEPHTLNSNVPMDLTDVILKGMALEVARRPKSVEEWLSLIQGQADHTVIHIPPVSAQPVHSPSPQIVPKSPKSLAPLSPSSTKGAGNWKVFFRLLTTTSKALLTWILLLPMENLGRIFLRQQVKTGKYSCGMLRAKNECENLIILLAS